MKPKIYCSIPITYSWDTFEDFKQEYIDDFDIYYWDRNSYYNKFYIEESNAIIFFLPDNKWSYTVKALPRGLQLELEKALQLKKSIYIAYKPKDSNIQNIYKASVINNALEGIAGTANSIFEDIKIINSKTSLELSSSIISKSELCSELGLKEDLIINSSFDKNLLFLI